MEEIENTAEPAPAAPAADESAADVSVPELATPAGPPPGGPEPEGIFMMERVVPAFFEASRAVWEGRPEAQALVDALIGTLEENAREAGEQGEGLWTSARDVFRAVLIDRRAALSLVEDTKALDKHPGYAWKALCTLCYLGGSIDPLAVPKLAVNLHMAVAEFICRGTVHMPEVYEHVIADWFVAYWTGVFARARFRFTMPWFVEPDLKEAVASETPVRVQRVLRTMAFGLQSTLPERGREWFRA